MKPHVISASRRTDIPAYYTPWLMNRLRAGSCCVPNPFDPRHVTRVSLAPEDVSVVVFWTRDPRPLLPHLDELDQRGYRYYFLFTLTGYPRLLEPHAPSPDDAVNAFRELSERVGPHRVIWRYDPILISSVTDADFQAANFTAIARRLQGLTTHCILSLADLYPKVRRRLRALESEGVVIDKPTDMAPHAVLDAVVHGARECGMTLASCAEPINLKRWDIRPGKCVDDDLLRRRFGIDMSPRKDPSQRKNCRCIVSRDIGMYDSCPAGCVYCYANANPEKTRAAIRTHDPQSPSLLGWHDGTAGA